MAPCLVKKKKEKDACGAGAARRWVPQVQKIARQLTRLRAAVAAATGLVVWVWMADRPLVMMVMVMKATAGAVVVVGCLASGVA
ncbi:hypothetical protein BC940DRAFT_301502 [Gongronella butleri]|nr:hypothetical protein BC940DRAFT_301502 [Gongronella butleri]